MTWIIDMETNGLLPECDTIHCIVGFNIETDEWKIFTPDNIQEFPNWCQNVTSLSCHNGLGFDLKVWKKLLGFEYKGEYFDTLLMSRILWPDMDASKYTDDKGKEKTAKGPHSVESWGLRFNMKKPEHEDWSVFTEEMLNRCKEDVKIQTRLFLHIQNHIDKIFSSDPRLSKENLNQVFKMEQKVWEIIELQCDSGWQFDIEKAFQYVDQLERSLQELSNSILEFLPLQVKRHEKCIKAFKVDGNLTESTKKWISKLTKINEITKNISISGDFCKVEFEEINLNSPTQIKDYLVENGWIAWEYNTKKDKNNKPLKDRYNKPILTSPKLPKAESDEWDYIEKTVNNAAIKLIAKRNKVKHRLSTIKGWILALSMTHRIHASVNTCGTNTGRMKHKIIVNVPKVSEKKFFGKEMRGLFIASPGKIMVGCDAKALEARIGAHYIYSVSKEDALKWVSGEIHDENALAWGCSRDDAKTGLYLLIFGGGAPKLALSLGRPISDAKELHDAFWRVNPALKEVKELAERAYKDRGYVIGLDKRPLSIRYKHAIISSLFQSGGAISMKVALCYLNSKIKNEWGNVYLGNYHDEFQNECFPEYADELGRTMQQSIRRAGEYLKLNIPLEGEYKIGKSWGDTH